MQLPESVETVMKIAQSFFDRKEKILCYLDSFRRLVFGLTSIIKQVQILIEKKIKLPFH